MFAPCSTILIRPDAGAKRSLLPGRAPFLAFARFFPWPIAETLCAERNPDSRASPGAAPARLDAIDLRPPPGTRAACEMPSGPEHGDAGRWSPPPPMIECEEQDWGTGPS